LTAAPFWQADFGFSLHASVAAKRKNGRSSSGSRTREYTVCQPISSEVALIEDGQVRRALKTPFRDGTTQ
jgi:hypothetical protein